MEVRCVPRSLEGWVRARAPWVQGPPFVPMSTGAVSDPGFPEPEPDGDTLAAQFQSKGTKGSCLCDYQEMGGKPPPQPLSAPGSWPSQGLGQEKEATC